jgi:hypothetical protein
MWSFLLYHVARRQWRRGHGGQRARQADSGGAIGRYRALSHGSAANAPHLARVTTDAGTRPW